MTEIRELMALHEEHETESCDTTTCYYCGEDWPCPMHLICREVLALREALATAAMYLATTGPRSPALVVIDAALNAGGKE